MGPKGTKNTNGKKGEETGGAWDAEWTVHSPALFIGHLERLEVVASVPEITRAVGPVGNANEQRGASSCRLIGGRLGGRADRRDGQRVPGKSSDTDSDLPALTMFWFAQTRAWLEDP